MCEALTLLLENIYIKFGTKLYKRSRDKEAELIKAFNSTSRHLDDLLNIDNIYFDGMVNQIYPSELQLKLIHPILLRRHYDHVASGPVPNLCIFCR